MISVQQAQALLHATVKPGPGEWVPLVSLPGRVLAQDVHSPLDLPPFAQSSMDGYAIGGGPGGFNPEAGAAGFNPHHFRWQLIGETRAGQAPAAPLLPGQARRVFTGAALPEGTAAVVRQEVAQTADGWVQFSAEADQPGRFVRQPGSAVRQGERILECGQLLNAGALSLLASCGLDRAFVYRLPRVSILSSGDELVPPGQPLAPGQIYESNSIALAAAVAALGIPHIRTRHVPDQETVVLEALREELAQADVLLLCGGISVGDYDFSGRALQQAGVEEVFYRVAQKPGMPLFFGRVGGALDSKNAGGVPQALAVGGEPFGLVATSPNDATDRDSPALSGAPLHSTHNREVLVFGLPGNPASTLVCFWEYAQTALRVMMGFERPGLLTEQLPLAHGLRKTAPRAAFERALVQGGVVYPMEGQDSYHLRSLANANALLVLPEGPVEYQAGEWVTVHRL